jgi:uncharacterized protein (TIGR02444 family)
MADGDNPFWAFSCDLYGKPGVADACLTLQDTHGLDVNVLLYCCWAGWRGQRLDPAQVDLLLGTVASWHREVVRPLRGVRRWMKTQDMLPPDQAEALRQEIKRQELEAERLEQAALHDALPLSAGEPSPPAAVANLAAYLTRMGCMPGVVAVAGMSAMLVAMFGEDALHPLDAVRLLDERFAS